MPICNFILFKFKSVETVGALDNMNMQTYSENSPQIQAAAYSTSQMPIRCMLPVNRWALSSRVAI